MVIKRRPVDVTFIDLDIRICRIVSLELYDLSSGSTLPFTL